MSNKKIEISKHALSILKPALRIWKYKSDTVITLWLAALSEKRKAELLQTIEELNKSPIWAKYKIESDEDIVKLVDSPSLTKEERTIVKTWLSAVNELKWKNEQSVKIEHWLKKQTHIPTNIAEAWVKTWRYA